MHEEGVECSRCGATFESDDELMVHSIDTHSGVDGPTAARRVDDAETTRRGDGGTASDLDPETVERLTAVLEERSTGRLTVNYHQRFLAAVSVGILVVALVISYLHFSGVLDTTVYMFALGTLFGLTLSYLQTFVQTVRG